MEGNDQTRAIEPGYLTQDITKVPGWHGLVAWDLLFNNLTTGLFLFAAVGELAVAGVTRSRGQGGVSRRAGLLAHRPADAGVRPGRSAPVPSHAPGVQAQLAHVPGHVEPHRLFAAADPDRGDRSGAVHRLAAIRVDRAGVGPQVGSGLRSPAGVRVRRLQGGALQHVLATGLEGCPMAGRLDGEFRTHAGLRGAARRFRY